MSTAGPGQLLFDFVRHWSRRAATTGGEVTEQGRRVLVTEAVAALVSRGVAPTVNAIGREIGIDQSGASRLIGAAAEAGYIRLETSRQDGRRREVSLTPAGRDALRAAHRWQEEVFADLTEGWSRERRDGFRDAMAELIARSKDMNL